MATPNLRPKSAVPQDKRIDLYQVTEGLNAIRAMRAVLDYLGEDGKTEKANVGLILAGLGEALEVAHERIAKAVGA